MCGRCVRESVVPTYLQGNTGQAVQPAYCSASIYLAILAEGEQSSLERWPKMPDTIAFCLERKVKISRVEKRSQCVNLEAQEMGTRSGLRRSSR